MSLRLHSLLRGVQKTHGRKFGTAVKVKDEQLGAQVCSFRTIENNPANHNADHIARMYTVPPEVQQQIYQHGGITAIYRKQIATFQEFSMLVRSPAVEIISYLTQADHARPVNKYILYGKHGTGKSTTISHIMHYAYMTKYLLLHLHWAPLWFRFPKEIAVSVLSPGCTDLPIDAGVWLKTFKTQNSQLLSQLDLKTTEDYVWNQRETTSRGTSILEFVDFGINRVKYACGVVSGLLKELKQASIAGKCRTMVVIDAFNIFTTNSTRIFDDKKVMVLPKNITLARAFYDMTKDDWCNGAVVLTVDETVDRDREESHLPRYLLRKEGFEHLDPFIPILVENYTVAEYESMVEYYKNRKWIRELTPSAQKELEMVTNRHPLTLMDRCKFL